MRTVGQILREEREKKFYSLEEIEKVTKIRKELLEALEADNWSKLPPSTFVQGFIKSYGRFLGLDTNKLLAIFRREFSEHKNPPRILQSFSNPLTTNRFNLTPSKLISLVVVGLVLVFFGYLWFEYRYLVLSPKLDVTYPPDQATVSEESITVSGLIDSEASLSLNNQPVAIESNGQFSEDIKLSEGSNTLSFQATSKIGKITKVERTVFLQP